jgi:hypothetical protein
MSINTETIEGYISKWYKIKRDPNNFENGQIVSAPIFYQNREMYYMRPKTWNDEVTLIIDFVLKRHNELPDRYDHQSWVSKFPHLESDEELLGIIHKIRPAVILSDNPAESFIRGNIPKRNFLCLPIYGLVDENKNYKNIVDNFTVFRMKLLNIPNLFWLPEERNGLYSESCIDFDKCEVINEDLLIPKNFSLNDEVLNLLFYRFIKYVSGATYMDEENYWNIWEEYEGEGNKILKSAP